jgi:metallo-beta-lactamase family protein
MEYPGQSTTNSVEESKAIRTAQRPMMVIASSGMLTGGRIMHHLKDFLPDPASTLLFIGYQGEGTLGRHLQGGGRTARIDGEEIEVRCRVRSISGFSAHADEDELAAWLGGFSRGDGDGAPQRVFLVHADPEAADAFSGRVRDELKMEVHLPRYRERVPLA